MSLVVGIHGPSGSGKTTLIERLIPRLQARGFSVGVIKHAHKGYELDHRGKDSWRMWQAGARVVLLAAPQETLMRQRGCSGCLEDVLVRMPKDLDCMLVEGFARHGKTPQSRFDLELTVSVRGVRLNGRWMRQEELSPIEQVILDLLKIQKGKKPWHLPRQQPK